MIFLVWVVTGDINCAEDLTEIMPFENEKYPFKHAPGLFPSLNQMLVRPRLDPLF